MTPSIEHDPRYPTWEGERAALAMRRAELESLIAKHGPSSADAVYEQLLAEGFDAEHAQDRADAVEDEHKASLETLKDEHRRIHARLSVIKPLASAERHAETVAKRAAERQEHPLLAPLERIAAALESLAGTGCKRKRRRKARTE